jgi:CheY-like chemotaxis protein
VTEESLCVLVIDEYPASEAAIREPLEAAGVRVEVANDNRVAIEKLKTNRYAAIVLDPMVRDRLNGYVVLAYIELEQPHLMGRVFLSTTIPKATIARTAAALVPRLFRKPGEMRELAAAVLASLGSPPGAEQKRGRKPQQFPDGRIEVSIPERGGEYPTCR